MGPLGLSVYYPATHRGVCIPVCYSVCHCSGKGRPDVGLIWPGFGLIWPDVGLIWPEFGPATAPSVWERCLLQAPTAAPAAAAAVTQQISWLDTQGYVGRCRCHKECSSSAWPGLAVQQHHCLALTKQRLGVVFNTITRADKLLLLA